MANQILLQTGIVSGIVGINLVIYTIYLLIISALFMWTYNTVSLDVVRLWDGDREQVEKLSYGKSILYVMFLALLGALLFKGTVLPVLDVNMKL